MKKGKWHKKTKLSDGAVGVILVLPAFVVFCTIILFPFVNSIFMSFTNRTLVNDVSQFVGTANYVKVFSSETFRQALKNTIVFVTFSTMIPFTLGFIWSIILDLKFRGAGFLRGVTLVNWIIPGASISFLWSFIFDTNHGIVNELLQKLGIVSQDINWLGSSATAMTVVIIARSWQMLPWYMAFLTGGLQGISQDQIEAARMDGAGNIRVFRNVVLPAMKPIMIIVLMLGIIGNLQHFDIPKVLTAGGPAGSTTTLSILVYRQAFENYKVGIAATIGTIWAILLAVFSLFYVKSSNKK